MNKTLKIILATICLSTSAFGQTRLEMNAEDVACEWKDKSGRKDTDICHITAQGTIMGETLTVFRIGNRIPQYVISDTGTAMLVVGKNENQKTLWEGKSKEKFIPTHGTSALQVIKISDGMTVTLFRK